MNPQILVLLGVVFTFFRDSIAEIFKSRNAKIALVGGLAYFLYSREKKKEKKEDILGNITDNTAGKIATQLFDAFHPYFDLKIPGIGYIPDGTDEARVKSIGQQMGLLQNYTAVSDAYKALYGNELANDLRSEGVFDIFMKAYESTQGTVIPSSNQSFPKTQTPPASSNTPAPVSVSGIVAGSTVITKGGWNLRSTDKPYGVIDRTVDKEDWIAMNKPYTNTIDGTTGQWVVIKQPPSRYIFIPSYYVVNVQALYTK